MKRNRANSMVATLVAPLLAFAIVPAYADAQAPASGASVSTPDKPPLTQNPTSQPDYLDMRRRVADTPGYDGEAANVQEFAAVERFMQQWKSDHPLKALIDAKPLIAEHPQWIELNLVTAHAFEAIVRDEHRDEELISLAKASAPKYRAAYEGLIRSVLDSGDGKTCKTGYWVISTHEEYALLDYLKLEKDQQALLTLPDGTCDWLTVHDADGHKREIFFDISSYFGNKKSSRLPSKVKADPAPSPAPAPAAH